MKIPSHLRFEIAAINDLCIDVGLAGKYEANLDLIVSHALFVLDVTTRRLDSEQPADGRVRLHCTLGRITVPGWGNLTEALAHELVREELDRIVRHLEQLLADSQEGQPS